MITCELARNKILSFKNFWILSELFFSSYPLQDTFVLNIFRPRNQVDSTTSMRVPPLIVELFDISKAGVPNPTSIDQTYGNPGQEIGNVLWASFCTKTLPLQTSTLKTCLVILFHFWNFGNCVAHFINYINYSWWFNFKRREI